MKIERSFLTAVKWAYAGNWGDRAFSALFTFLLAAILGPRDFGVVSIGLICIGFMQMVLDQGLAAALVQRKELEQEHCDAAFWMTLLLALVLVVVTVVLSGWWARVNHAPDLAQLLSVMSLSLLIEGLSIVQSALLRRNMDFRSLAVRSNASVVIGGIVGLCMAAAGCRAWSLVGQQLARDLSAVVLLWKLGDWRPRLRFSWSHVKALLGFSVHNFIAQLAIFADMQAGSVLLGVLFGPVPVGLYRLADRLMNSLAVIATSSIQAVSLPEFSRVQDQPQELRRSALLCIRLSATVTVPALAGLAAVSGPLLATLGRQWIPATDALRLLSFLGMSIVLSYFTGPLLQALGRPKQLAMLEWARMALGMAFLVVTALLLNNTSINWQVSGIALARLVPTVFLVTPVFVFILMHFCKLTIRDLIGVTTPSMLSAGGILLSTFLFRHTGLLTGTSSIAALMSQVLVGGVVGLAILAYMDKTIRGTLSKMASCLCESPAVIE